MSGSPEDREIGRLEEEVDELRQRAERAERILAALREPSEDTVEAATCTFNAWHAEHEWIKRGMAHALRAAVAAAEKEVGS